jgi:hypothetical protein
MRGTYRLNEARRASSPAPRAVASAPGAALPGRSASPQQLGNQALQQLVRERGIAAKLHVTQPGDAFEREADRTAEQVLQAKSAPCSCGGTCSKCRAQNPIGQHEHRPEPAGGHESSAVGDTLFPRLGAGQPLDRDTRRSLEERFGAGFGSVRVHSDAAAAASARALRARAYTVGRDVVFGAGQYAPQTREGRRLLAHELTHVVQQRGGLSAVSGEVRIAARPPAGAAMVARASLGEMWGAFWGVGPIDALRASTLADEALAAAQATGLPGLHNGPADAWRHCFWNCNMTHALGYDQAETIATNHESHGGGPANENQMDLFNNEVGRNCGGTNCDGCCQGALDAGRLRVIDSTGAVVPSTVTARGGATQAGTSYSGSSYSTLPPARRPPPPPREPVWHCFTGRMTVTMADGKEVPIEQVVTGDRVLAYDDAARRLRVCEVLACHEHPPAAYLKVWLQDGRLLEVTWNHDLYAGGGWVQAGQLRKGSVLYLGGQAGEAGLAPAAVERIEHSDAAAPLFDITVADCHNYFVSGVLVHNKNI